MDMKSLSALVQNEHFLRFVALLSVPQSPGWRMRHPKVPSVRATLDRLMKLSTALPERTIIEQFLTEFAGMLVWIVEADESLRYSERDMTWIVESLESRDAPLIFSLLFAYASCPVHWYSAEQLSEFTDKAASTWRNLAAEGSIIGTRKVGKVWLFPASGLIAYGVTIPSPLLMEVEEQKEGE
jgi:hypothetical protein